MPKFLKAAAVQPGATGEAPDQPATAAPCRAGEWVTPGSFAVCNFAEGYRCDPPCGCDKTFLSLNCQARCGIAEVVEVDDAELAAFSAQLSATLLEYYAGGGGGTALGASAQKIAEREIQNTLALAGSFIANARIAVQRTPGADGSVEEMYRQQSPAPAELPTSDL